MARYLLSTELILDFLYRGLSETLVGIPLQDLAVSALSFAQILAELEADPALTPIERQRWRSNVLSFRQQLRASGGQITIIDEEALESWQEIWNMPLFHVYDYAEGPIEMSSEERLVLATAAAEGLIYLTLLRDWNSEIETKLPVSLQVA